MIMNDTFWINTCEEVKKWYVQRIAEVLGIAVLVGAIVFLI